MSNLKRAAGYCDHCQKGVTVRRPTGKGFFGRIHTTLTNNEESWVCSKCGNPASKGFNPPANKTESAGNKKVFLPPITTIPEGDGTSTTATDFEAATPKPDGGLPFAGESDTAPADAPSATCHLCQRNVPCQTVTENEPFTCPGCKKAARLPDSESDSSLTTPLTVIKLEDNPQRPEISKSLCALCRFEMTYPKKLAGKEVDCPSCNSHFQLP